MSDYNYTKNGSLDLEDYFSDDDDRYLQRPFNNRYAQIIPNNNIKYDIKKKSQLQKIFCLLKSKKIFFLKLVRNKNQ
jgi:hypothetical protein